ncbi:ABC transporter [Amylibacter marinus]|uniref:ABC transporter n=1 Tax=Amylibacter marinus TaxID=1475483 RepID=A0ABQ5VXW0_9RHOB|nr:ATP-binding cassette domain-containing protein [Amylibacter marinus]GLQ36271.1 ABC transporter [Amylibacter marinus]
MIEFQNVSKSFWTGQTRKVILDKSSFVIEPGQSLGILAENGTGKTTLINMMCGIEKPDEGKVIRRSRISFPLGFSGGIAPKQSAQENCRYIARLYALDPDYVESFCRYICDFDAYFEMPVSTYSRGMRARFSLAILLSLDFDYYLIDEGMPNSTDAAFNARAGEILMQKLQNATVVIVSHNERILEKFAHKAAVLGDGRLQFFDSLADAKEIYDYSNAGYF